MAKRHNIKLVDATELKVDRNVNFREDYDIPSMMEEIVHAGRVLEPLHVRKEDNIVLKGNRRLSAVQALLQDKSLPAQLLENISKLEVIYWEGLDDKEVTELVLDHGSQKPLSRVEVVLACWRLQTQMYSEKEIIILLYHLLARYTGAQDKAYEASKLPAGPAREEYLKKWLHGTVGNFILSAGTMGPIIREQFILSERKKDRALTDEEKAKVLFETSRDRINKLASAKKKDKEGKGWNPAEGGEEFNKLITEFIEKDKNPDADNGSRKPTPTEMTKTAESMVSPLALAYQHCAGTLPDNKKADILSLDAELFRLEELKKAVRGIVDKVEIGEQFSGAEIREVFRFILGGNAIDAAKYFERFATKVAAQ